VAPAAPVRDRRSSMGTMIFPGFLSRTLALFLAREGQAGRSLHMRAAAWATLVLGVVILLGSYGVVAAERGASEANLTSYPRALWWSAETATTVGYGDFYPVTVWGRVIACAVMFAGITTYGMITAAIAAWFVGREQKRQHHLQHLHERFDRLEQLVRQGQGRHDDPG
jgi:voltage-gated potassium channel